MTQKDAIAAFYYVDLFVYDSSGSIKSLNHTFKHPSPPPEGGGFVPTEKLANYPPSVWAWGFAESAMSDYKPWIEKITDVRKLIDSIDNVVNLHDVRRWFRTTNMHFWIPIRERYLPRVRGPLVLQEGVTHMTQRDAICGNVDEPEMFLFNAAGSLIGVNREYKTKYIKMHPDLYMWFLYETMLHDRRRWYEAYISCEELRAAVLKLINFRILTDLNTEYTIHINKQRDIAT